MCLPMKTIVLSKRLNVSLIECLDPAADLQKIQRAEEHVCAMRQMQTVDSGLV